MNTMALVAALKIGDLKYEDLIFAKSLLDDRRRVVGGRTVTETEMPDYNFYVGLLNPRSGQGALDAFFCSGVLITRKHVLTAAHCDHQSADAPSGFENYGVDIIGGSNILSGCPTCDFGTRIAGSRFQVHEGWLNSNGARNAHDIAIIELEREVTPADNMAPIPRIGGNSIAHLQRDDPLQIVGFGDSTVNGKGDNTQYLQTASVPFIPDDECRERWNEMGNAIHTEGKICAGGESHVTSCKGDSGGPIWGFDATHGPILLGVVSWGDIDQFNIVDCHSRAPTAYTEIAAYSDWIDDALEAFGWHEENITKRSRSKGAAAPVKSLSPLAERLDFTTATPAKLGRSKQGRSKSMPSCNQADHSVSFYCLAMEDGFYDTEEVKEWARTTGRDSPDGWMYTVCIDGNERDVVEYQMPPEHMGGRVVSLTADNKGPSC